MITAQFSMGTLLLCVAIFAHTGNSDTLLVLCMTLFMFVYQATVGNLFWPYVSAVIQTEAGFSLASLAIWSGVLFMSVATNPLMEALGITTLFLIYSGITFTGGLIFIVYLKEIKGVHDPSKLYC